MMAGKLKAGAVLAGVFGLALLVPGILTGCGTGDSEAGNGAAVHEGRPAGDDHGGHDHETEAAGAKETPAAAELKSVPPSASYPLATCVVSGESLTGMGGPIAFEYEGTEVQFCCSGCIKEFRKDPARYVEAVRAARK